jgi:hypothetical protein
MIRMSRSVAAAAITGVAMGVGAVGVTAAPAWSSCVRTVAISSVTDVEGSSTTGTLTKTFTFVVSSTGCFGTGTVDYETFDATAVAGDDYVATAGTLTLGADIGPQLITVPVVEDTVAEADDRFGVALCNPTGDVAISATAGIGYGTIRNDDHARLRTRAGVVVPDEWICLR